MYNVHLKLSQIIKKSKVSSSVRNIFKIELPKQNDGGVIKWVRQIRFKHMPSGLYLGAQQVEVEGGDLTYKFTLLSDYHDENTLFQLQPMAADNIKDYAMFNSLARVRHHKSGLYLGAKDNVNAELLNRLLGFNPLGDPEEGEDDEISPSEGLGSQTNPVSGGNAS